MVSFTREEFWWAVGLLLTIVCIGSALLWVAMSVSNARRARPKRHGRPADADPGRSSRV